MRIGDRSGGLCVDANAARRFDGPSDGLARDPIDRAYLARFTLGNAALEREVLELFAAHAPVYLQRLREADCAKAWNEALHTLKGSAGAIGAWRLMRLAEMAERIDIAEAVAVREGHRQEAAAALATATDEVCRFIARSLAA
jgi:HPt (histidine-containing phosphotransfer) domain-containing protein